MWQNKCSINHHDIVFICTYSLIFIMFFFNQAVTDYHDSSDTGASEKHNNESLTGKIIQKINTFEQVHERIDMISGRHRKKLFTRLKSASTSRLNYSISSKYESINYFQ